METGRAAHATALTAAPRRADPDNLNETAMPKVDWAYLRPG